MYLQPFKRSYHQRLVRLTVVYFISALPIMLQTYDFFFLLFFKNIFFKHHGGKSNKNRNKNIQFGCMYHLPPQCSISACTDGGDSSLYGLRHRHWPRAIEPRLFNSRKYSRGLDSTYVNLQRTHGIGPAAAATNAVSVYRRSETYAKFKPPWCGKKLDSRGSPVQFPRPIQKLSPPTLHLPRAITGTPSSIVIHWAQQVLGVSRTSLTVHTVYIG